MLESKNTNHTTPTESHTHTPFLSDRIQNTGFNYYVKQHHKCHKHQAVSVCILTLITSYCAYYTSHRHAHATTTSTTSSIYNPPGSDSGINEPSTSLIFKHNATVDQ